MKNEKNATGAWSKVGHGYCLDCAADLSPEDFDSWDTEGDIVCDNCGKDTEIKDQN